jgi:hypothetical protein
MNIVVDRKYKLKEYTIGRLYVDGEYVCDTLEDTDRGLNQNDSLQSITKKKVYGSTAIPIGTYSVKITYSTKFKCNLPLILNVPGYDGIRIHSGNTAKDTLGCILCGMNKVKGQVIESKKWTNTVISYIIRAEHNGEKVSITIG